MENFYDINFKEVGTRIKEARKKLNLTQEKAAEHAVITGQFWSLVETGKERASVNTYRQIAAVLGLTLDDLFYDNAVAMRVQKAFCRDGLLVNCNNKEKAILGEAFLALKVILERNRK